MNPSARLVFVVFGISSSGLLLSLLIISMLIRKSHRVNDLVLLLMYSTGLLFMVFYLKMLISDPNFSACIVDDYTYVAFYTTRLALMVTYYVRLRAMIGTIYPGWLSWPCIVAVSSCWIVAVLYRIKHESDNWCEWNYFWIVVFTRFTPSAVFLVLFVAPLLRFDDPIFRKLIKKHGSIFAVDVSSTALFLFMDSTGMNTVTDEINTLAMIIQQLVIVFIFADAKSRLCFWTLLKKTSEDNLDDDLSCIYLEERCVTVATMWSECSTLREQQLSLLCYDSLAIEPDS